VGVVEFDRFGRRRMEEREFAPGVIGVLGVPGEKGGSRERGAVEVK
jgi:hypothetical protein